jgi:superfamily II DNA or RNA helicase/cation transport regulator ChaB
MSIEAHWNPVSYAKAEPLIDMKSGQKGPSWEAIAEEQLKGAVDLYRRLGKQRIAWLCDEVGLGKTYVAMAVAALVRRQHPEARILYLLPSSRLLPKWTRELKLFSQRNVKEHDHLLRTLQDRPARPLVPVDTLHELALEATLEPDRDFLCTSGAFSFALPKQEANWEQAWSKLLQLLPPERAHKLAWKHLSESWDQYRRNQKSKDDGERDKLALKVAVAEVINSILPDFDLIICDESHNLRHGLSSNAARNRLLSVSLGGVYCAADADPDPKSSDTGTHQPRLLQTLHQPLRRRARRVLMLTATPFRSEYAELSRQAAVFGFVSSNSEDTPEVARELQKLESRTSRQGMTDEELVEVRDNVVKPLIVRRLGTLKVGEETCSRNRYRRELREGGMDRKQPEGMMQQPSVRQRLLLALVQKRVLDILQPKDTSVGWKFQMGLLSSFESFGQTIDTTEKKKQGTHEGESTAEGRSVADQEARTLDQLIDSYQRTFKKRMPHPKLEQVAKALATEAWENGEKSLVFVRRVRTTEELATQITWHFDNKLNEWIFSQLPDTNRVREEWGEVFRAFSAYREALRIPVSGKQMEASRSLFGWYFRSRDKKLTKHEVEGVGGALNRHALDNKRPWAIILEDNPMLVLFEHDRKALREWASTEQRRKQLIERAQRYAFINQVSGGYVNSRGKGSTAWFQAFQAAALDLLSEENRGQNPARSRLARELRALRFPVSGDPGRSGVPNGEPADWLVLPTLFSQLQSKEEEYEELHQDLLSETSLSTIETAYRTESEESKATKMLVDRDQRQAVFAQLLRGGRSYLDLWLAVVTVQGSMEREKVQLKYKNPNKRNPRLIQDVVEPKLKALVHAVMQRLKQGKHAADHGQAIDTPRQPLTAYLELARVSRHFDLMRTLNFPTISEVSAAQGRRVLRSTLTGLEPVIALHGSSKTERALEQFRMPGFPMVMVATSVVQEGVDLHTFCRKVVHYGIDGSATGTEQRNGRVDRRGSLVSRLTEQSPEETIDVYFPHLRQSLEPLQMATLYQRMNRFLLMSNQLGVDSVAKDQAILCSINQHLDEPAPYPEPYAEQLTTAFDAVKPEEEECCALEEGTDPLDWIPDLQLDTRSGDIMLSGLVREGANRRWRSTARLNGRVQPILLEVDSGLDRGHPSLVIESHVWPFEIKAAKDNLIAQQEQAALSAVLQEWTRPAGVHLLSRRRGKKAITLTIRSAVPLEEDHSQTAITAWVCRVAAIADELEQAIARSINIRSGASNQPLKDHEPKELS